MLVKKGKNFYMVRRVDGKLIWKTTKTSNAKTAEKVYAAYIAAEKAQELDNHISKLLNREPAKVSKTICAPAGKTRLLIKDIIATAEKYKEISVDKIRAWNRFTDALAKDIRYADQITADIAFAYLNKDYGKQKGKTWNNNRSYINSIFRTILIDAGLPESPFQRIIQKRLDDEEHQRPFTEDECAAIIEAAKEPWRSAAVIAYYTGLRQKDCFALRWNDIKDGIITTMPGKTARFGRSVRIPIHPQLSKYFNKLPKSQDGRVLGFVDTVSHKGRFTLYFGELLDELDINDNDKGTVEFNCFRNTFITRCRAAGVQEHAIRGVVGHIDSEMTDLYSHDITSAMEIQKLPKLSKTKKDVKKQ
jgi:integrase